MKEFFLWYNRNKFSVDLSSPPLVSSIDNACLRIKFFRAATQAFPLERVFYERWDIWSHILFFSSENIWVTLAWVTEQMTRNKWHVWYKWAHCPSLLDKYLYTQINSTFSSSADPNVTPDELFDYIMVVQMMTWREQRCREKPGSRAHGLCKLLCTWGIWLLGAGQV